jgi:16S rRNA (uracil1498-N3)-methyltransferase
MINKKTVEVYIDSRFENQKNPTIHLRLFQSLSSSEKMDWIIQKSVELGVSSIIPMYSERSNIKFQNSRAEKKLSHWQQVIISACEQSGRSSLPNISLPKTIEECLNQENEKKGNYLKLILSPEETNTLQGIKNPSIKNIDIMIGPEGGFTEEELSQAIKSDFILIGLGPRILRTETAPLSILSILQYKYGDFA